jgi:hypothetical protein
MPAPKGNEFWKLRSKHGKEANFTDSQKLYESACQYFQSCIDNPLYSTEFLGKDAEEKHIPKLVAFTWSGLCIFLHVNTKYFNDFRESELGKSKDFSEVITCIGDIINTQKFTGAAAGLLNANIIARDLGLADKQDVTNKTITVTIQDED